MTLRLDENFQRRSLWIASTHGLLYFSDCSIKGLKCLIAAVMPSASVSHGSQVMFSEFCTEESSKVQLSLTHGIHCGALLPEPSIAIQSSSDGIGKVMVCLTTTCFGDSGSVDVISLSIKFCNPPIEFSNGFRISEQLGFTLQRTLYM